MSPSSCPGVEAAGSPSADDEKLYRQAAIDAGVETWNMLMEFRKNYPQFFGPFPSGHQPTTQEIRDALEAFFPPPK